MTVTIFKFSRILDVSRAARTAVLGSVLGAGLLFGGTAVITAQPVEAAQEINVNNGYAVHGYDPVAYFTEGKPVEGDAAFTATHEGAAYKFTSAEHRDMFVADPAKYAPQYGGFCAFGVAMAGRKFDGDPELWKIEDGKLYLNINKKAQSRFLENVPGYVRTADHNWPIIAEVPEATLKSSPPSGLKQGAQ
jgi:YHS domain-containing protein